MHSPDGTNQSIRVDRSRPFVLRANSGQGAMERGRTDGRTDGGEVPGKGLGDRLSAWDGPVD